MYIPCMYLLVSLLSSSHIIYNKRQQIHFMMVFNIVYLAFCLPPFLTVVFSSSLGAALGLVAGSNILKVWVVQSWWKRDIFVLSRVLCDKCRGSRAWASSSSKSAWPVILGNWDYILLSFPLCSWLSLKQARTMSWWRWRWVNFWITSHKNLSEEFRKKSLLCMWACWKRTQLSPICME